MLGVCCSYFTIKHRLGACLWPPSPQPSQGDLARGKHRLQQKGILAESCQVPLGLRAGQAAIKEPPRTPLPPSKGQNQNQSVMLRSLHSSAIPQTPLK